MEFRETTVVPLDKSQESEFPSLGDEIRGLITSSETADNFRVSPVSMPAEVLS